MKNNRASLKISVAVATYNNADFLVEQLNSIVNQTLPPDEIIIGDDASTDNTVEILKDFAEHSPVETKIFFNPVNIGFIRNFNSIIDRCEGDVIFLSDGDDKWMARKIEKMVEVFQTAPDVGLVFSNAEYADFNLELLGQTIANKDLSDEDKLKIEEGKIFEILVKRNIIAGAFSAFKSEYRKYFSPLPYNLSIYHDAWISLVISSMAKVGYIKQPLSIYRQHSAQVTEVFRTEAKKNLNQEAMCEKAILFYNEKINTLNYLSEILRKIFEENAEIKQLRQSLEVIENQIVNYQNAGEHFMIRKNIHSHDLNGFLKISKEFWSGKYHKFSNGTLSFFKDLQLLIK